MSVCVWGGWSAWGGSRVGNLCPKQRWGSRLLERGLDREQSLMVEYEETGA